MGQHDEKRALAPVPSPVADDEKSDHCTSEHRLTDAQRAGRALWRDLVRSVIHASDGSGETMFARRLKRNRSFVAARLDRQRALNLEGGDFLAGASATDLANLARSLLALADARRAGLASGPVPTTLVAARVAREVGEAVEAVISGAPIDAQRKEVREALSAVEELDRDVEAGR